MPMNAANVLNTPSSLAAPPLPDRTAIESAAEFLRALVPPMSQYVWS